MIYFTAEELLRSVLHSIIYGAIYVVLMLVCSLLIYNLGVILSAPRSFVHYQKITELPSANAFGCDTRVLGAASAFLKVLIFSLGYILLSYYSLDGMLRIYTLIISVLSALATDRLVCRPLSRLLKRVSSLALGALIILLRIVLLPARYILNKNAKSTENEEK